MKHENLIIYEQKLYISSAFLKYGDKKKYLKINR